jgi:hypothetical protein
MMGSLSIDLVNDGLDKYKNLIPLSLLYKNSIISMS